MVDADDREAPSIGGVDYCVATSMNIADDPAVANIDGCGDASRGDVPESVRAVVRRWHFTTGYPSLDTWKLGILCGEGQNDI